MQEKNLRCKQTPHVPTSCIGSSSPSHVLASFVQVWAFEVEDDRGLTHTIKIYITCVDLLCVLLECYVLFL